MIRRTIDRIAFRLGLESTGPPPTNRLVEEMRERSRQVEAETAGTRRRRLDLGYRDLNRSAFGRDPWPRDQGQTNEQR